MEWQEITPKQQSHQKQWDLTAYYGEHIVGSIVLDNENEFHSIIGNSTEFIDTTDLDTAKAEFYERLETYLSGEIDYYTELLNMLKNIR